MPHQNRKFFSLYPYLSYAGALPFLLISGLFILQIKTIAVLGNLETILSSYSLIIAVFMSGSLWGLHLKRADQWLIWLPLISNFNAISLWFGYLIFSFKNFILLVIINLLMLILLDRKLAHAQIIESQYYQLRLIVTLIVVTSLLISLIFASL